MGGRHYRYESDFLSPRCRWIWKVDRRQGAGRKVGGGEMAGWAILLFKGHDGDHEHEEVLRDGI